MPRGKKSNTDEKPAKAEFHGFLNIKLTDDEWNTIDAMKGSVNLGETLKWLTDFGKVTFSYNDKNSTYNCTCSIAGGRLEGWAVSSFSTDLIDALTITVYKLETYHDTIDLGSPAARGPQRG